eukprot:Blabericola_migrator_1__6613@NODE_3337_length_1847_cov_89_466292_g2085_i0_p2_GENE_NODE_3337_length_1847_cov_89_466292_g2085_i0NODE_3337_length_1847_cov_89_466292_g2085_i0_p2_ORF_typecomplete_len104_score13_31_NODE_3337_length_1847_cov_89_466292_g2085_i0438749
MRLLQVLSAIQALQSSLAVERQVPPENPLDAALGNLIGYPFGYSYYSQWPFALRKAGPINLFGINRLPTLLDPIDIAVRWGVEPPRSDLLRLPEATKSVRPTA